MTPEDAGARLRCLTLGSVSLCLAWHLAPDSMPGATARAADLCRFDKCRPHSAICDASRGSGCALRRIADMMTTCAITRAGRHKNMQGVSLTFKYTCSSNFFNVENELVIAQFSKHSGCHLIQSGLFLLQHMFP